MPGVDIKKDDTVMVRSGKDRGRSGRVVNVLPRDGKVMVEGIARVKRHTKPTPKNRKGGIILQEEFIDLSNVQVVCKTCNRPTRVGHRSEGDVKVRVCRRCGAEL
jgi:large subunit ribosomal protein L24